MMTLRHLSVTLLITAALSALTVTRAQDDRPPSGGLPPPTHDYDGCPPPTKELCEVDRPQECQDSSTCKPGHKCCPISCNGLQCMAVEPAIGGPAEKPGQCLAHIMGCPDDQPRDPIDCNNDYECPDELKCCSTPCFGRTCQHPDISVVDPPQEEGKPGQCEDPKKELSLCMKGVYENSTADCSIDKDCSGNLKCCEQTCVKPKCKPPMKPGECPMHIMGCPAGQEADGVDCNADEDCKGSLKCCSTGCFGKRCQAPQPVVNPGECPMADLPDSPCEPGAQKEDLCSDDGSCKPGQKCCPQCMGKRCVNAEPIVDPPPPLGKPGQCDDFAGIAARCLRDSYENSTAECDNDFNCKGNMKCCRQLCVKPLCKAPLKPGSCPMTVQGCREGQTDPINCSEDFDCSGNLKCCYTGCGGRVCVAPEYDTPPPPPPPPQEKPGECIVSRRACLDTTNIPKDECSVDIDCKGNLKCCRAPCGNMVCSEPYLPPPPEVKPGQCVRLMIACFNTTDIPKDACSVDGDCKGDDKCCPQPCGNLVCTQTSQPPPPDLPGQCPTEPIRTGGGSADGGSVGICAFLCEDDSSCGEGQKCCRNECGGTVCQTLDEQQSCPQIAPPVRPCLNNCFDDSQCGSDERCCKNDCGGKQCYNVNGGGNSGGESPKVIPQACPYFDPRRVCAKANPRDCEPGSRCKDGSLCCEYECGGARCQPVLCPSYREYQCVTTDPQLCNATDQCHTEDICCSGSCSGRKCQSTAAVPIEQPPKVYPRACPYFDPNRVCLLPNPRDCEPGSTCSDGSLCCEYECGGARCQPVLCPGYPALQCFTRDPLRCNATDHCGSDAICCDGACSGRSCVATGTDVKPPPPAAAPVCPVFDRKVVCKDKRSPYNCNPQDRCVNGGKCCEQECGGTQCSPGLCPAPEKNIQCFVPESRDCESSSTCGEGQVCCEIHCNGTRCQSPTGLNDDVRISDGSEGPKEVAKPAPGPDNTAPVCPQPADKPVCNPALQKRACQSDSQCGARKCCDTGCDFNICQTPVRPGSCPQVTVRCREPTPADGANRCGTDMACRGNQKCCPSPCPGFGSSCVDPVL